MSETAEQYRQRKLTENSLALLKLKVETDSVSVILVKNIRYGAQLFLLEMVDKNFRFFIETYQKIAGMVSWAKKSNPDLILLTDITFNTGFREGYTYKEAEELTQLILEEPYNRFSKN